MIHNTYRRLDEPSLQLGPLTLAQWLVIAVMGGLMYGLKELTGMGTQAILCIATVTMGGPFALMALSEGGRPSYARMFRDALKWAFGPKFYAAGGGAPRPFTLKADTPPKRPRKARAELPVGGATKELTK